MTERTDDKAEDECTAQHEEPSRNSLLHVANADVNEDVPTDDAEDDDEGLPIDKGWAWVVTIAVQINIAIVIGYTRALGILFIEFLRSFKASVAETTLITGVMAAIFGLSVFISMQVLVGRFKVRTLVMIGGAISSFGIIASYFATNVVELILTQGIFIGAGNSLIHGPGLVLLGKYFKKKRALANAVANSGISAGSVLYPPLVKLLLDEYGLKGTLLILGGVNLHVLVCGALLWPIETFQKIKANKMRKLLKPKKSDELKDVHNKLSHKINDKSPVETDTGIRDDDNQSVPLVKINNHSQLSRLQSESHSRLPEFQSQSDIYSFVPPEDDVKKIESPATEPTGICGKLKSFIGSLGFYLWKDPSFICLIMVTGFAIFLILFLNYFPAYVKDRGTSEKDAAMFISIAGAIDFFARLAVGFFANAGYVKRTYICAFGLFVSGINCHLIRYYTTYELQLLSIVIYGIFGGIYNSFIPVLLADILGVQHLAKSLGFTMITHGIVISLYHPIVGALKDVTGSYITSYHVMGTSVILGAVILLTEPLFSKCKKNLQDRQTEVIEEVPVP